MSSPLPDQPIRLPVAALALLCAALWGGTTVAIRFTQDEWPPLGTAGLRFALGTAMVYLWCRWDGQSLSLRREDVRPIVLIGGLLFVQIGLFHWGMNDTSAAHGAVIIGSNPLWIALLAHFVLSADRLSAGKVIGLTVAMSGLVAVVAFQPQAGGHVDPPKLIGNAVVLLSSLLLGIKTVCTKHMLSTIPPGKLLFWSNLLGAILLLASGLMFEGVDRFSLHPAALWGLFYQGVVVAGFCFAAWTALLRRHRASQLAVFGFAQPLFGIVLGVCLRGDPITAPLLLGGAAVAAGILIVTRRW